MTEHTQSPPLSPTAQKFVLHWGEMGTRWGINRTVAQIHALLFISPRPLPADEIAVVLAVHVLGDRRDHFDCTKDVFEIFRIVSEERKRREIDPTLKLLAECVQEIKTHPTKDTYTLARLESMLDFLSAMTGLFEEVVRMPDVALRGVVKLRGKVITLLGTGRKKAG